LSEVAVSIEDFAARLEPGARLLGVDLGTRTIGLAVSDSGRRFANPLMTLRRTKFREDAQALVGVISQHGAGGLVIGLPLNMNGTEGPRSQSTRAFARNLAPLTDLPMTLWDERLTTVAAERAMLDADLSRAKRAERIDAVAAALILQGALDRLAALARITPGRDSR